MLRRLHGHGGHGGHSSHSTSHHTTTSHIISSYSHTGPVARVTSSYIAIMILSHRNKLYVHNNTHNCLLSIPDNILNISSNISNASISNITEFTDITCIAIDSTLTYIIIVIITILGFICCIGECKTSKNYSDMH